MKYFLLLFLFTSLFSQERTRVKEPELLLLNKYNTDKNVSINIVKAIDYCLQTKSDVVGIVSRDGGHTAQSAIACVKIPIISSNTITPHAEAWQAVIWHLMVTDPRIISYSNKWESIEKK